MTFDLDKILLSVGVLVLAIIIARLVKFMIGLYLKFKAYQTTNKFDDFFIALVEKPLPLIIILIAFYFVRDFLDLSGKVEQSYSTFLTLACWFLGAYIILRLNDAFFRQAIIPLARFTKRDEKSYRLPLDFLRRVIKFVIFFVSCVVIANQFGFKTDKLLTGVGISGLAIGFAAKDILSNIISSIVITMVDRPFEVGDQVKIADKYAGKVKAVGIRSTVLKTKDGAKMFIPNSMITNSSIENLGALLEDPKSKVQK